MTTLNPRSGGLRFLAALLCSAIAFDAFGPRAQAQTPTALVSNAPTINGTVKGSVQQMAAASVTLNSNASITDSLYVPGTPK
ncbi:MAG: hypothetical protein WAN79_06515, partial [Opitutaceae bacterium]